MNKMKGLIEKKREIRTRQISKTKDVEINVTSPVGKNRFNQVLTTSL